MSPASISTIVRAVVALEAAGGNVFFGEPALRISDWLTLGDGGKGMINILDSESLINNGKMYSAFLLWMLSELFETLPEVGDLPKPKMVSSSMRLISCLMERPNSFWIKLNRWLS